MKKNCLKSALCVLLLAVLFVVPVSAYELDNQDNVEAIPSESSEEVKMQEITEPTDNNEGIEIMPMAGVSTMRKDGVRLRKTASSSGTILGLLNKGDTYWKYPETKNGFTKVFSYKHSQIGWISTSLL